LTPPEDVLISIDLGTSSIRVALIDYGLVVRHQEQATVLIQTDLTGAAVQDANEIIDLALDGLIRALAWAEDHQLRPMGMCFSSTSASLVALDASYRPLAPALTYLDLRAHGQVEALIQTHGTAAFRYTGAPLHASYWLPKFLWLAEKEPQLHQAAHFCSIKDLLVYRLTGQFVTDVANAGANGICDVRTLDWDPALLQLAGLRPDQLPRVCPTTTVLDLNPVVNIPGLMDHSGLKVVLGAMDGMLSSLGAGAFLPGQVTTTIGSSGACRVAARTPLVDQDPLLVWSYPLDADLWIKGGAMNNGGLVTQWLVENFSSSGVADEQGYADFFSAAVSVMPGAEGLIFLPYLFGERAPIYNEQAKGAFIGLDTHHHRAHFARAGLEGILMALYSIYELVRPEGDAQPIRATGGYLRSEFMLQMQADIFGVPIATPENLEGSVIGAAMVGMRALGVIRDYAEMTKQLPLVKVFTPDEGNHRRYQQQYQTFRKWMTVV